MNTTNLTCFFLEVEWQQSEQEITASAVLCVFSSLFALSAVLGNGIVMLVIWKTRELHSPSFALLFCLAASDFFVGLVGQPSFVAFKVAEILNNFKAYCNLRMIQFFCGWITSGVSFLTLSGVSIDRLLALTLHLRYKNKVSVRRVIKVIVTVWLFCSIGTILKFWVHNWIIVAVTTEVVAIITTAFCTSKIFCIARRHERQINKQNDAITSNSRRTEVINVRQCKKSAITVIYVYILMLAFYLPFLVVMAVEMINDNARSVKVAYEWATMVVFINSSVNPCIYCWRIKQIQHVIKRYSNSLIFEKKRASSCKIQPGHQFRNSQQF